MTADRRGDDQVVMWSRLGAEVLLGPTISTVKVPDPELLRRRSDEIIDDPPDFVIANTGVGMRTWLATAEEWGVKQKLVAALEQTRIASRGPKATGALGSAGLSAWWRSPNEHLSEVVDRLLAEGVAGRRVAFQLHGDDGAEVVVRLEGAGAEVTTVPVYVWRPPPDPGPALELIGRCCEGSIDAVTFTAGPQVRSMLDLAAGAGRAGELVAALNQPSTVVGCIGPVCAAVAVECGLEDLVVPDSWRLGSLVKVVTEAITAHG